MIVPDVKADIDRIVAGLMRQYQASHDDAVEATHEAWLNIQGREYNEKARMQYWFISAKNEYLDMVNTKTVPIEEHHMPTNEQPSIEDKFQSRKLDRLIHKLESDEWTLLEMIRYSFPNSIIAEAFGWEDSTVRTRKSELIRKIKTLLT